MKTIDLRKRRDCPHLLQRVAVLYYETKGYVWVRDFYKHLAPRLVPGGDLYDVPRRRRKTRPRLTLRVLRRVQGPRFSLILSGLPGFALNHDGRFPGTFGASLPTPNGLVVRRHPDLGIACALVLLEANGIRVKL